MKTTDWLLANGGVKKLADEASKNKRKANETVGDFRRVNKLLSDVRSELVLTQKALSSSREKRDEQEELLAKQLIEVEEQKSNVVTYMTSLNEAKKELDSERVKLRATETWNQELMLGLSLKKDLIEELQGGLNKEKSSLQQAIGEICSLQDHLNRRNAVYEDTIKLLQMKEEDMAKARLKIQHLSSEQASLQLLLEQIFLELSNTRKMLEDVNQEMAELRMLMDGKEEQLTQAATTLKETEEHAQTIQHQLHDTNLRLPEAENFTEHIAELTKKLVISPKGEDHDALDLSHQMEDKFEDMLKEPDDVFRSQKEQLETELQITRENLRLRKMEVLSVQGALTIKDVELKVMLERVDEREEELRLMNEKSRELDNLGEPYTLTHEKVGDKSVGDLTIEKLQLEAAQLKVEAATNALEKLTEMSHAFVNSTNLSMEIDYNIHTVHENGIHMKKELPLGAVEKKLVQLTNLTDQLVKEAGIVDNVL